MIKRICLIFISTIFMIIIIFQMIYRTLEYTYSPLMLYKSDIHRYENISSSNIRIPRLIHQIHMTSSQNSTVNSIIEMNKNDFTYRRWSYTEINEFVKQYEPIFYYQTYINYRHHIQRINSFRYVLMYHIGGIYIDINNGCNHPFRNLIVALESLDPDAMHLAAFPRGQNFGVENDFLISSIHHPFYRQLVSRLDLFNHNSMLHFWTIFFSSGGSSYVYIQHRLFSSSKESVVRLIDNPVHRSIFSRIEYDKTWFDPDAHLLIDIDNKIKMIFSYCNIFLAMIILRVLIKWYQQNKFYHLFIRVMRTMKYIFNSQ